MLEPSADEPRTQPEREPAIELYKKLGFVKYGVLKKASIVGGKYVDNILMEKGLG